MHGQMVYLYRLWDPGEAMHAGRTGAPLAILSCPLIIDMKLRHLLTSLPLLLWIRRTLWPECQENLVVQS